MDFLEHYTWKKTSDCGVVRNGRIAVRVAGDRFQLAHLAGEAPPAGVLRLIWGEVPDLAAEGKAASEKRSLPFVVRERVGMSGCRDVILRIQRNEGLRDYPIMAGLHVSMAGKLNEGVEMWIGDLREIIPYVPIPGDDLSISQADKTHIISWRTAFTSAAAGMGE